MFLSLILASLFLVGCLTLPNAEQRKSSAVQLAAESGWNYRQWSSGEFTLAGFAKADQAATALRIYIEGDGLAWITTRQPSRNPTPVDPVALQLALMDKQASVYLARPCQYVLPETSCSMKYWTSHRYAEEVVEATSRVISKIKKHFAAQKLELFGYSGGGAIAALVAARRDDVSRIVTVAGNLDHDYWTMHHKVSALLGSLNPADYVSRLQKIPQVHLVGAEDENIPVEIVRSYSSGFTVTDNIRVQLIPGFDHDCCWVENWESLLKKTNLRSSR